MTTHQSTTDRPAVQLPHFILPPVARSYSDLAILQHEVPATVAQAQAAGNLAYAAAAEAGLSLPDQSDAYHTAFTEAMRALGCPMPCGCAYCAATDANEGGN